MKFLLGMLMFTALSAHALETDNYLSWGKTLPDSTEDINEVIKTQIEDVLERTPVNASCENVTFNIAYRFKTTPRRKLFENWSEEHLTEKMFPSTPYYLTQSIYRNTSRFYLSKSGLSPNVMVNGIYFGVDKLSHFGSTGRRYLQHYLKRIKKGMSPEEAEKSAIRKGLRNEAGILGIWPSGVFSYGDIEANFQGFQFYKKFCLDEQDTYLEKVEGKWTLVQSPDIRTFVSPYWDETFNLSYRAPGMWAISSRIIQKEYCPLKDSEEVVSRFKYYEGLGHQSRSLDYVRELQAARYYQAPIPTESQSIDLLCSQGLPDGRKSSDQ